MQIQFGMLPCTHRAQLVHLVWTRLPGGNFALLLEQRPMICILPWLPLDTPMLHPSEPRKHRCPISLPSYSSQQVSRDETNWSGRNAKTQHFSKCNITHTWKRCGGSCRTVGKYALVKMVVVRQQSMLCSQYCRTPTLKDVYWSMLPMSSIP